MIRTFQSLPRLYICMLALVVAGCIEPYRYQSCPPHAAPGLGEVRDGLAAVKLFYATDRNRTATGNPRLFFGGDRTNRLKLGQAHVTVPPGHGMGRLESPAALLPARSQKHILLTAVDEPIENAAFLAALRTQLELSARHEILVYLHGFDCTFEDAARRGAQIAHDIDFDGPLAVYSWPSQGWLFGYLADSVNADWTQPYFVSFLKLLTEEAGAAHVHILAHSMGNRVLIPAIKELIRQRSTPREPEFDQIVLAAADMDTEVFQRDFAPYLVQSAQRITIYVSDGDWALSGSQRLHHYARLGQPGNATGLVTAFPKIDVVDATAHDRGVYGHLYYGSSPRVLHDLHAIMQAQDCAARNLVPASGMFRIP